MTVPNVRDGGARFRRIAIAFVIGVATSIGVYFLATGLVAPDAAPDPAQARSMNPFGFVFWATFLSGAVALTIALAAQNYVARERARAARAQAQDTTP